MDAPGATRGERATRSRAGQNVIELALLMPLLALIMLGATDFARVFIAQTRLTDAVMAGATYAMRYPDKTDTIKLRAHAEADGRLGTLGTDFVIDSSTGIRCYQGQTNTLIATTPAGNCAAKDADGVLIVRPGDTVEITATYAFKPITGQIVRLLGSNYTIRARVRMVVQ